MTNQATKRPINYSQFANDQERGLIAMARQAYPTDTIGDALESFLEEIKELRTRDANTMAIALVGLLAKVRHIDQLNEEITGE